jgi:hypothetical protein
MPAISALQGTQNVHSKLQIFATPSSVSDDSHRSQAGRISSIVLASGSRSARTGHRPPRQSGRAFGSRVTFPTICERTRPCTAPSSTAQGIADNGEVAS